MNIIKSTALTILLSLLCVTSCFGLTTATVKKIVDGDTIKVILNSKVEVIRFIGMDAPEKSNNSRAKSISKKFHEDIKTITEHGKASFAKLESLLPKGTTVEIEFDVKPRDDYGRMLAYVRTKNGELINEKMISEGYAYAMTVPPNVKYAGRFKKAFAIAKKQKKGLWRE